MTTDPMDDDGYPSEGALACIRAWDWRDGAGLLAFVRALWYYPDYWIEKDGTHEVSTGGWSGNESLIEAMEQNRMFWRLWSLSWRRGGHYEFKSIVTAPAPPKEEGPKAEMVSRASSPTKEEAHEPGDKGIRADRPGDASAAELAGVHGGADFRDQRREDGRPQDHAEGRGSASGEVAAPAAPQDEAEALSLAIRDCWRGAHDGCLLPSTHIRAALTAAREQGRKDVAAMARTRADEIQREHLCASAVNELRWLANALDSRPTAPHAERSE